MTSEDVIKPEQRVAALNKHKMPVVAKKPDCIDDRQFLKITDPSLKDVIVLPQEKGPQLLGGSIALLPVLAETFLLAGKSAKDLKLEELMDINEQAHQEPLGMQVTVHMDDHHGQLSQEQIIENVKRVKDNDPNSTIPGCGYVGLLTSSENKLNLSDPVTELFQNNSNLVEIMVRRGANLIVLTGEHADKESGKALAVRNNDRQTTLDIVGAHKNGIPAYNHDDWAFDDLMGRAAEILEAKGEVEWVKSLRENGRELNDNWLNTTTDILAGMEAMPF